MRLPLALLLAAAALPLTSGAVGRLDAHMSDLQFMRAALMADDAGTRAADYGACGVEAEALRDEVRVMLFLCRAKPGQAAAVLAAFDRASARRQPAEARSGHCVSRDDAAFQLERMVEHLRRERAASGCSPARVLAPVLTSSAEP